MKCIQCEKKEADETHFCSKLCEAYFNVKIDAASLEGGKNGFQTL